MPTLPSLILFNYPTNIQARCNWGGDFSNRRRIKAEVNCPRCSLFMNVLFSDNCPNLSSGNENDSVYDQHTVSLCPNCNSEFYLQPNIMAPLQGRFLEIVSSEDGIANKTLRDRNDVDVKDEDDKIALNYWEFLRNSYISGVGVSGHGLANCPQIMEM